MHLANTQIFFVSKLVSIENLGNRYLVGQREGTIENKQTGTDMWYVQMITNTNSRGSV